MTHFADRVIATCQQKNSRLVVGLDPHWHLIPESFKQEIGAKNPGEVIAQYMLRVVERTLPFAVAFKPQVAFFEQFGVAGMTALKQVLDAIHSGDGLALTDAKRNDIGSTAQAYARAYFGDQSLSAAFPSDALTINAYLGSDGVKPFTAKPENGVFVLVKTSNPSSGELQDLLVEEGVSVAQMMARAVDSWNQATLGESGYGNVGAVVGATYPQHMRTLRKVMPGSILLVPGYGAQGGAEEAVSAAFNEDGLGALINSSRGISFPADYETNGFDAIERAAQTARDHINSLCGA